MEKVKLIGAITLAVLALIVMVQNRAPVDAELLFWTITMPRAVLLLLTFTLGLLSGWLISWWRSHKRAD